jgi:hypothetical protein
MRSVLKPKERSSDDDGWVPGDGAGPSVAVTHRRIGGCPHFFVKPGWRRSPRVPADNRARTGHLSAARGDPPEHLIHLYVPITSSTSCNQPILGWDEGASAISACASWRWSAGSLASESPPRIAEADAWRSRSAAALTVGEFAGAEPCGSAFPRKQIAGSGRRVPYRPGRTRRAVAGVDEGSALCG